MAPIQQLRGKLYIDNAGGTLTDISVQDTEATLSVQNRTTTYNRLNEAWDFTLNGVRGWRISGKLLVEPGTNGFSLLCDLMFSATMNSRTIRIDQPDSQPGSRRYEGEACLGNLDGLATLMAGSAEPVEVTYELIGDGPLTASVIV